MNPLKKIVNRVAKTLTINRQDRINTVYSNETGRQPSAFLRQDRRRRGVQVYTTSQILAMSGRNEDGILLSWGTEQPYFYLTADQRNQIFRLSSIIFGIVSSRMNRISAIDFEVSRIKKIEDQIADELKDKRQIYNEYRDSSEWQHLMMKAKIVTDLRQTLPLLKSDMSNFDACLLRWKKAIQRKNEHTSDEIKEWMLEPNQGVTWEQYIKKVVYNLMIHGSDATYKQEIDGRLENFDSLVGGSVFRLKEPYFTNVSGFIQVISGFEPQIFFENEICYMEYLSTSVQSQSMVPLEALINLISEQLLFSGRMAEVADGTMPPEKMVIITENNPFGQIEGSAAEYGVPIDPDEQKRIETKLNEPRKNAIMTFSGNDAKVIDLSRDFQNEFHNARGKDIREECAMVFNMSNMEINLTGSADVSGRATSETQQEIEQGKGTGPILKTIQTSLSKNIIPHRFGSGWHMEFRKEKNELSESQLYSVQLNNGEITVNELREKAGRPIFEDDQYNKPKGAAAPGADEMSPMFTKQV